MEPGTDWTNSDEIKRPHLYHAGVSPLRAALLFGAVAVSMALFLVPAMDQRVRAAAIHNVDTMVTGSVRRSSGSYTMRRSVLQSTPGAVCIIRADGTRVGSC